MDFQISLESSRMYFPEKTSEENLICTETENKEGREGAKRGEDWIRDILISVSFFD